MAIGDPSSHLPVQTEGIIGCSASARMDKPVNLHAWLEEHGKDLKPPVGNKLLYGAGQLKVMLVGGPNRREDFHIEDGEVTLPL